MAQTSILARPVAGYSGQLALSHPYESVSKVVGGSAAIAAGLFVVRGTDLDREAVVPAATTDITGGKALGFALWKGMHINPSTITNTDRGSYQPDETMPVVKRGYIWVRCETVFVAGTKVFVRFTVNGDNVPGGVRNDADTDKAVALPDARFENSGSAAGLALIRFNVEPTGT